MKIFSLFCLIFLLVALLEVSSGFPFYGHYRISSNSSSSEHGQQTQNHGDVNGNSTGRPTGSSPSGSRGPPPSGTTPSFPTGSSTLLSQ